MAFKVFISYSTKDLPIVDKIKNLVQNSDVEVFVAEYSVLPSESLSVSIEQAIKSCDLFVLIWSKNSQESSWVPQEIGIAKAIGKRILPIVLNPNLPLPGFIRDLKYLDNTKGPNETLQFMQTHVLNLANNKIEQNSKTWLILVALFLFIMFMSD